MQNKKPDKILALLANKNLYFLSLNTDSLKKSDVVNDFTSDAVTQPLSANRGKWLYNYKVNARVAPKKIEITANQDVGVDLGFHMGENYPVILILGFYSDWRYQYTDAYLLSGCYAATVFITRLINTTNSNTTKPIDQGGNLFGSQPTITFSRLNNSSIEVTINSPYNGSVYIEAIG